jgi:radical SAM superfamily enzyme YgiQ (UPF0313 family)
VRLLFIQDNGINESLALADLSSYLKQEGHETFLLLDRHEKDITASAAELKPDAVLIPVSLLMHRWALNMAQRLKEKIPSSIVIFGGSHPTFFPEIIKSAHVDYVIRGEAEQPMKRLLAALAGNHELDDIPGLVRLIDGELDSHTMAFDPQPPDEKPLPDRAMYFDRYPFMARFPWKKFAAARGCMFECSYCVNEPLKREIGVHKKYWRVKSPQRIIDEVTQVRQHWALKTVHFSDDVFTCDANWLDEFAELYSTEIGLPFSCNAAGVQLDERRIAALKKAGCYVVSIGVETSDETKRLKQLNKHVTNKQLKEVCRALDRAKLDYITFNIAALPGETVDEAFETLRFNHELGSKYMRLNLAIPLPGTGLAERGFSLGVFPESLRQDHDAWAGRLSANYKEQVPLFDTPQSKQFINFFMLYEWAACTPALTPLIRRLVDLPPNPLFRFLHFVSMVAFSYGFKISKIDGFKYFLHVGHPENHTTVYPHLI